MSNKTILGGIIAALVLIGAFFVYGMIGTPSSSPPDSQDAAMEQNPDVAAEARQNATPVERQTTGGGQ